MSTEMTGQPLRKKQPRSLANCVRTTVNSYTTKANNTNRSNAPASIAAAKPALSRRVMIPTTNAAKLMTTPTPPNGNGGSPALQDAYFQYFDELFLADPKFRAATVFQLYDWSPPLARLFGDFLRSKGETIVADRFE